MKAKEKAATCWSTQAARAKQDKDVTTVSPATTSIIQQNNVVVVAESRFISGLEVAELVGRSRAYGYSVCAKLNKELENGALGRPVMTVSGKVLRSYFYSRFGIEG